MIKWIAVVFLLAGCAQTPVDRYKNLINPRVESKATRAEMDQLLGKPAICHKHSPYSRCEYRTTAGRHRPTPIVFKKSRTMRVDTSPYDYFDVLHLYYNADGQLKKWEPVAVQP